MCECTNLSEDCSICSVDLYDSIDKSKCSCLNEQRPNSIISILNPNRTVLGTGSQRIGECISDCDGELLCKIAFDGTVKLGKIFVKAIQPVSEVKVFINDLSVDFSSLDTAKCAQHWNDLQEQASDGLLELETKTWKFLNVTGCCIWIKSQATENLAVVHLGFAGEYLYSRNAPLISSYEVAPQPSKLKQSDLLKGSFFQ